MTSTQLKRDRRSFDQVSGPEAFTASTIIPAGTPVEVIKTESHGSAPWTRYTLRTIDEFGGRRRILAGAIVGHDI